MKKAKNPDQISKISTINKFFDFLLNIPMTIISGTFLALSFTLPRVGISFPFDPAWLSVAISGFPILYHAVNYLITGHGLHKISSSLLISIAMIAAASIGDLFAAGEVAFIMAIGTILENLTANHAKSSLKNLVDMAPTQGRKLVDGKEIMVNADDIQLGDILRVRPGETIPVDGTVVRGESSADQSIMTGESLPADKAPGDDVYCGTINLYGFIDIKATQVGDDSSLQKLIHLIEGTENTQAPIQRTADKWASLIVPLSLLTALLTALFTHDLVRGITILVVFCPCALVLATPTAIMASIGQASKRGVIIKSGEVLEKIDKIDTVTFDKTGTLTEGHLSVCNVLTSVAKENSDFSSVTNAQEDELPSATTFAPAAKEGSNPTTATDTHEDSALSATNLAPAAKEDKEAELLSCAFAAEANSEHPIGVAISSYCRSKGLTPPDVSSFKMHVGQGVSVVISSSANDTTQKAGALSAGCEIFCGNPTFLSEHGIAVDPSSAETLSALSSEGKVSVCVAYGGSLHGIIALSDTLRPDASEMVSSLHQMGVSTALLTGDNHNAASYFARLVGIDSVHPELLPQQKVDHILSMQAVGHRVLMLGDGVNDAPSMKCADIGVAMGGIGSDITIDSADIALMTDDLSKLPYLKRLSHSCTNTIKFGIALSMTINLIAVILSILGLLTPTTGALVHNIGSVLVVMLSSMLCTHEPKGGA